MNKSPRDQITIPDALVDAILCQSKIAELPHSYYRYPARFVPTFAREVIRAFSKPGDLIVDPFCGGGTTIIEAIKLGRRSAGMDISPLATFISRTKTTPLSVHDERALVAWLRRVARKRSFGLSKKGRLSQRERSHYERNLPDSIKLFFSTLLAKTKELTNRRQEAFVRLMLLSLGQHVLDSKETIPNIADLRDEFVTRTHDGLKGHIKFLDCISKSNGLPRGRITSLRRVIHCDAQKISSDRRVPRSWLPAKLIVTSPPYPGVHVLYHRWQIHGRKETPAPFWLANSRDGAGEAHYTFGPRQQRGLTTYFTNLRATFGSIRALVNRQSLIVQLVGFSAPEWQLPRYLATMEEAGFEEVFPDCNRAALFRGRVWRDVPSRRWYACIDPEINSSREVLLLHRRSD